MVVEKKRQRNITKKKQRTNKEKRERESYRNMDKFKKKDKIMKILDRCYRLKNEKDNYKDE